MDPLRAADWLLAKTGLPWWAVLAGIGFVAFLVWLLGLLGKKFIAEGSDKVEIIRTLRQTVKDGDDIATAFRIQYEALAKELAACRTGHAECRGEMKALRGEFKLLKKQFDRLTGAPRE